MLGAIVRIDGWDTVAAATVTLRAASSDAEGCCHLDGAQWIPAIAQLPRLRYELFDGDFSGRIGTPASSLVLATRDWPNFSRYMLADARIRIWTGEIGDAFGSWTLRFDGRVLDNPANDAQLATINFAVDDRWLDKPLLATYAGTTGAEGEAAQKGTVKPLALGAPRYAPGQLIDATDTILQLSSYGLIEGVETGFENLNIFTGSPVADHASFAALDGATIAPGKFATCKAEGLVRHGAPPANGARFVYHVKGDKAGSGGWVRKPGALIKRIAILAGAAGKIDDASLDALDASKPYNVSLHVTAQTTARELIQRLAASVNAVAGVSWTGKLFAAPIAIGGSASVTLKGDDSGSAILAAIEKLDGAAPFWKLAIEAERTWGEHGLNEVNFSAALIERGLYSASESYREGHIVSLADGSRWLYINPTPTVGNAPAAGAYWSQLTPPLSATDLANFNWGSIPDTPGSFAPNLLPLRYQGFTESDHPVFTFTRFAEEDYSTKNRYLNNLDAYCVKTNSTTANSLIYFGTSTTDYNFYLPGGKKYLLYCDQTITGSSANARWQMFYKNELGVQLYSSASYNLDGLVVYELDLTAETNNYRYLFGIRMLTDSPMASDQRLVIHAAGIREKTGALATVPTPDIADYLIHLIAATAKYNADETKTNALKLSGPGAISIKRDYLGVPKTAQFNIVRNFYLTKGDVDVSASASWAVSTHTGYSRSISSSGALTISSVTSAGVETSMVVTATYAGVDYPIVVQIGFQDDPPPSGGGLATATFTGPGTTSYVDLTGAIAITTVDSSANIVAYVLHPYTAGAYTLLKIQYSADGTTGWADVGSEATGQPGSNGGGTPGEPDPEFPGSCQVNVNKTGLSTGVSAFFRVMGKRNTGSGALGTGNATVTP